MGKGALCGQSHGFNLQNATRITANDKNGRERLCRYFLRPPLANDTLKILDDGHVRLDFKRPWSDGTSSVELAPLALLARLAAPVANDSGMPARCANAISHFYLPAGESYIVPVRQPTDKSKGQGACGQFAVDLVPLLSEQLQPQRYAIWTVSRQHLSEPIVVDLPPL